MRHHSQLPSIELQAYAAAFFALPLFRSVRNAARNVDIDRRNSARQKALRLLANPDPLLRQKLAAAQAAARQNVITNRWGGAAND